MTNPSIPGVETMLKPCPFCGSKWVGVIQPANGSAPYVLCRECGGAGAQIAAAIDDPSIAEKAWNTRA